MITIILSSLDGRINGPFIGAEAVRELSARYGRVRTGWDLRPYMTAIPASYRIRVQAYEGE